MRLWDIQRGSLVKVIAANPGSYFDLLIRSMQWRLGMFLFHQMENRLHPAPILEL